jgi:hypothetical protein
LAFFNALAKYGASNCTQRTDDFVSGSRTQTLMFAELFAVAPVTAIVAPTPTRTRMSPADAHRRENLFTAAS